ncbi:MAG: VOC family protein [Acidimicrobiia bacterium]
MADTGIEFGGLNLVARDVGATVAFYRRLGFAIPEEKIWRTDSGPHHTEGATLEGTFEIEIDSSALASVYNAGYSADPESGSTVIGFRLATREAVDIRYADLIAAGYRAHQEPYDTFWGARYAIVCDPDGRDVGLMGPSDPERRSPPPKI